MRGSRLACPTLRPSILPYGTRPVSLEPLLGGTEPLVARDHPGRDAHKQVQAVWRGTCVRKHWRASAPVVGSLIDS